MKVIAFIFKSAGFLVGLFGLGLIGMVLAGPLGWPYELFSSWPYLIALAGFGSAVVLGFTGWPRFATLVTAGALLVIALAMASPGDLTRPKVVGLEKGTTTTLVWGNSFVSLANVAELKEMAAREEASIIAIGETPGEMIETASKSANWTTNGGISVDGCQANNQAFTNEVRYRQTNMARTYAIKVACPEFTLFAVHLTNPLWQRGERMARRREEFQELAAIVKAQTGPVVVIGDFNTAPNAQPFSRFMKEANLSHSSCGGRWLPTWRPGSWRGQINDRNPLTGVPIDHLFTRDVDVLSCAVGKDFGSDHLPLTAEFRKPTPLNTQTAP